MSASSSDLFRQTARRWVSQIGAGGVTDAVVTTIPLSSSTNLPTATAVTVTIDRVDANGTTTASKEETVTGVVSGNNLVSCTRGVEGTAQAHDAGAVVELLFSNKIWNDFITGMLVEHGQDGTHSSAYTASVKATGAQVSVKTVDTKFITPKALSDSKVAVAYAPAGAGTTTIDLSTGNEHVVTMPATTQTLAISNATTGQKFIVSINNVTSQGTLTWFSTIKWAGGTAPTLTGTNGKRDTFGFIVTGTGTYDGFVVGQNL